MTKLSIDIRPELHKVIKEISAEYGGTMRGFVLDAIHEKIINAEKRRPDYDEEMPHDCKLCRVYRKNGYNKRTLKALAEAQSTKEIKKYNSFQELRKDLKIEMN